MSTTLDGAAAYCQAHNMSQYVQVILSAKEELAALRANIEDLEGGNIQRQANTIIRLCDEQRLVGEENEALRAQAERDKLRIEELEATSEIDEQLEPKP